MGHDATEQASITLDKAHLFNKYTINLPCIFCNRLPIDRRHIIFKSFTQTFLIEFSPPSKSGRNYCNYELIRKSLRL